MCGKTYTFRQSLHKHQKFECGKAPQFACPENYCNYITKRKDALKVHINDFVVVTAGGDKTPLKFGQIPAHLALPMLLMRQSMENSMLSVGNIKGDPETTKVFCPNCGRAYKLKSSLRNHMKWECGKEPQFNCPYCPYKAKQKMHITRHIERMHKVVDFSVVKQEMQENVKPNLNIPQDLAIKRELQDKPETSDS
nr:unnamed protein product [Callosobruchus analis]